MSVVTPAAVDTTSLGAKLTKFRTGNVWFVAKSVSLIGFMFAMMYVIAGIYAPALQQQSGEIGFIVAFVLALIVATYIGIKAIKSAIANRGKDWHEPRIAGVRIGAALFVIGVITVTIMGLVSDPTNDPARSDAITAALLITVVIGASAAFIKSELIKQH